MSSSEPADDGPRPAASPAAATGDPQGGEQGAEPEGAKPQDGDAAAKPRRRRGGRGRGGQRRGNQARAAQTTTNPARAAPSRTNPGGNPARTGSGRAGSGRGEPRRRRSRMRTVDETSAGGLVVDGLDGPEADRCAALIGRTDRRGRMLWSLPKGHLELGETAEQAAVREVSEETGIDGTILAPLGSIDYWFVTEGRRVHKTVHHFLLRFTGGELCDEDAEVTEVAWVPLTEMATRLAYSDERKLVRTANAVFAGLSAVERSGSGSDGPAHAAPRSPSTQLGP